ncbi:MAG: integral rane sensor signal transduction histidine kinase [Verrucomicrobia bacterium]|nr:integral rane sensor signal transduction histidine kinase [Verrucomicrobiota bacterium]
MIARSALAPTPVRSFRTKLLVAMMLVVSAITGLTLYFAQHQLAANVERDLERGFQDQLDGLNMLQEIRHAALVERCRDLVRKSRIHAALEDGAPDLLYPSAKDELRDVMESDAGLSPEQAAYALHAEFYRFLDHAGRPILPAARQAVGMLSPAEELKLALPTLPNRQQIGYLPRKTADQREVISEVIAMPIVSSETGEAIAAIVLGFKPVEQRSSPSNLGMRNGIWLDGRLYLPALPPEDEIAIGTEIGTRLASRQGAATRFTRTIAGGPHLLFYKRLNPGSLYPPAYEVSIHPLAELRARQRQLRWQVVGAGGLLLLIGLAASQFLSRRLAVPVEKLEVDSAEHLAQRVRAEAKLESTNEELQRAARFSADASHQLKTPVTVLRAGLEEMLAHEKLSPEECREISALVHQTYRLSSVIEDLLLLSRMDAGRLKIDFTPVNLSQLIEGSLDDLGALPDALELAVETDFPADLHIAGEKRYAALILQNLLENARKYNRPGGRIRIAARTEGDWVYLTIGNTGQRILPGMQDHIFERFHRGAVGENVPGYGLGLNLARQLAGLHQGDLRLVRSDETWTEFEVRFQRAEPVAGATGGTA